MRVSLKKFLAKIRLLTLLVLVASVTFMVRLGDVFLNLRTLSGAAQAEEVKKEENKKEESKDVAEKALPEGSAAKEASKPVTEPSAAALKTADESAKNDAKGDQKEEEKKNGSPISPAEDKKWLDVVDDDAEFPDIRKEMYEDLLKRRQTLDEKEKSIAQREALVEAAQKEIDRKYSELESLKTEIQGLLKKQTEEEDTRIASLVKIYSGMKPKDAARIFNTLDMDVLLSVVSKMPESKSALIIANMEADPARNLTTMLAEQRKMPDLPQ